MSYSTHSIEVPVNEWAFYLSAGHIKPEEAHRKVMVILREYGMPSRQAITSVPVPKPIP